MSDTIDILTYLAIVRLAVNNDYTFFLYFLNNK